MDKLEGFIDKSIQLLKENEHKLVQKKDSICKVLEKIFEEDSVTVIGRVKSEKSLREKIIRNNYYNKFDGDAELLFKELSDMIGVRINCILTRDEEKYYKKLKDKCKKINEEKYSYRIESPDIFNTFFIDLDSKQPQVQKNGKDIYRIDAFYKDENEEFKVELQIKSLMNSLWGEIDHKLFYKNYEYLLSQDFYSGLMKLLYDNLDSVEKQLELLKDHMEGTDDELQESQGILARLLYNKYNNECKSIAHNCNIDFRPICKLISELYFCDPQDHFDNLNQAINRIKSKGDFVFKEVSDMKIEEGEFSFSIPKVQNLSKVIQTLIDNENVYWRTFINIFSIVKGINIYTKALTELAKELIQSIDKTINQAIVDSEVIFNDDEAKNIIEEVTIKCFEDHLGEKRKIEVFLDENLKEFGKYIMKFLMVNSDLFSEESEDKVYDSMQTVLFEYVKFIIIFINEDDINFDKFKTFIEETSEKTDFIIIDESKRKEWEIIVNKCEENQKMNIDIKNISELLLGR